VGVLSIFNGFLEPEPLPSQADRPYGSGVARSLNAPENLPKEAPGQVAVWRTAGGSWGRLEYAEFLYQLQGIKPQAGGAVRVAVESW
jgi:hypothetical protein